MKKNVRYSVDDIVVNVKDDNLTKYLDVYDNKGKMVTSVQLHFDCYEDEYGNEISYSDDDDTNALLHEEEDNNICPNDCSCKESDFIPHVIGAFAEEE